MTRAEFEDAIVCARCFGGYGLDQFFSSFLRHDAEQRQAIDQLRKELELLREDDVERCILIRDMEEEERRKDAVIEQQAQQIAALKSELSHWTWVRFKQLEEENAKLREALEGMLFIFGHNDGYVQVKAAKQIIKVLS